MKKYQSIELLLFVGLALWALPSTAHAYLDPGTGSLAVQVATAAVVGGLYAFKVGWRRVVTLFKKNPKEVEEE